MPAAPWTSGSTTTAASVSPCAASVRSASLSADTVYAIHVDAKGTVWVGTRGGGLNRVVGSAIAPRSIRFRRLTEKHGLPNETIYGIQSDSQGAVWVSTNYGLARVDPTTERAEAFHRSHGLQGEEFGFGAAFANARGELFFGGPNGFNVFNPADLAIGRQHAISGLWRVALAEGEADQLFRHAAVAAVHHADDDLLSDIAALGERDRPVLEIRFEWQRVLVHVDQKRGASRFDTQNIERRQRRDQSPVTHE